MADKGRRLVGIIDYGTGNHTSVARCITEVGGESKLCREKSDLVDCSHIVLPGVGHFRKAIGMLNETGMREELEKVIDKGKPVLGICLGMQLLCKYSEEGGMDGLGIVDLRVERVKSDKQSGIFVPHIGWSSVKIAREERINKGLQEESSFYFSNSYGVSAISCRSREKVSTFEHGKKYVASFQEANISATQYHPEKSYESGLCVMRNFLLQEG